MAVGQTLLAAIVLSVSAQIRGQPIVTVSPPSVAATNGDQNITINCTIQNPNGTWVVWEYLPIWSPATYVPIYYSRHGNNSLADAVNFSVSMYDYTWQGYQYKSADLTIKMAQPGQAATYKCSLVPDLDQIDSSSLVVIDPLHCPTQDASEYPAGATVNIVCRATFYYWVELAGIPILEIFKGDSVTPLPGGVSTLNRTTQTVTVNQTLMKEDDNVEFICRMRFENDDPIYSDNCSVVYYVVHEVSEIIFYPESSSGNVTSIPVGGQITCSANGRPAPTIAWYNDNGNLITEGNLLTVTEDMKSWVQPASVVCRANNTINGGLNYTSIDANYTFFVVDAVPPVIVQTSGVEPWVIAVAVIVPVVVLTAIAIAIFFIIRHRKKKKKAKKTTNGSTIYNTTATTATTATTSYTPVATSDPTYASPNRPPPSSSASVHLTSAYGPPGFDGRHDTVRYSPGFGDLGAQPHHGSAQAVNAYPTRNSSVNGSSQALGGAVGLSMNPNPGYQGAAAAAARASNPALNASISSRPAYPYKGSNPRLDASLSLNPNPGAGYGRQPSSSSASSTIASGYNAQAMHGGGYPNDLSSMPGSEV